MILVTTKQIKIFEPVFMQWINLINKQCGSGHVGRGQWPNLTKGVAVATLFLSSSLSLTTRELWQWPRYST